MQSTASSVLSFPLSSFKRHPSADMPLPVLKVISHKAPGRSGGPSHEIVDSLEPIIRNLDTRVLWFAPSEDDSSFQADLSFSFYPLKPQPGLLQNAANFCADHLFPLFHGLPIKQLDINGWKALRQLNEVVAASTLAVSADSFPILFWLHDFQLALTAPLLSMQAGTILAYFWHSPWPKPEYLLQSPIIGEFVQALLSNNIIAFQNSEYAENFCQTVRALLPKAEISKHGMEISYANHLTKIEIMPLGIDWKRWQKLANDSLLYTERLKAEYKADGQLILGIDRSDPSRGIMEKLLSLDYFLSANNNHLPSFQYVQIIHGTESTQSYSQQIKAEVARINKKYGRGGWSPIILQEGRLRTEELAAWYQAADVLIINPLIDGYNLIGKEFIASRQDEDGLLILSNKCGSAKELAGGALLVEPINIKELAQTIELSLKMPKKEKKLRMAQLRKVVSSNKLEDWTLGLLNAAIGSTEYR